MVLKCTCKHEYQDEKYGSFMRVHTPIRKGGWRCTVCSNGKDDSVAKKK